jgi:UDP-glucose 4-epimerase
MLEQTSPKVILVGASGKVGQLVDHFWQKNLPFPTKHIVQKRHTSNSEELKWAPLEGRTPLEEYVTKTGDLDVMIVLAGVTPRTGKDLSLNTSLAMRCLEAAKFVGIKRVLLASSSAVYGIGSGKPFDESDIARPINEYGAAKLEMEKACDEWRDNKLEVCCLRIGNVAGADALLLNIAESLPNKPVKIEIFKDGHGPMRSYIGPETLSQVLHSLSSQKRKLPDIINIAAPAPIYMESLAAELGIQCLKVKSGAQSIQNITLNCDRLKKYHHFIDNDSAPSSMVSQWAETIRK